MADFQGLIKTLEALGYTAHCFDTAAQAADYLDREIDGQTVGFGGSLTLKEMELYPRLSTHNQVFWHWEGAAKEEAISTDVYVSSVNAMAETGEIINIDGVGNRIASTLFGHHSVYFVVGANKLAPDYDAALWRARNVAAPKNARRLGRKTPCAVTGRCSDCKSPNRVCKALSVLWGKPMNLPVMEILLVKEELGM